MTVVDEESDTIEKDQVIRYEPEEVEENGSVVLYVSSGPHVESCLCALSDWKDEGGSKCASDRGRIDFRRCDGAEQ